jgi:excisionase family DNA binding protein
LEPESGTIAVADLLAARHLEVVPRLALSPSEAAEAIGVSRRHFFEHVLPQLRVVRSGRRRLIPVHQLESWLEENAERVFEISR